MRMDELPRATLRVIFVEFVNFLCFSKSRAHQLVHPKLTRPVKATLYDQSSKTKKRPGPLLLRRLINPLPLPRHPRNMTRS